MASGTARLLTVLELLQSREMMTGSEIAARMNVDVRSVRRYIQALQEMGIPVDAERGRYGAYRLDRGFRLPPMMFTEEEAVALTLGLMVMRALHFPVDQAGVAGAQAKIERVMPQAALDRSRSLQSALHFSTVHAPIPVDSRVVQVLATAISQRLRVQIAYRTWNDEPSQRTIDPYGIVFQDGWWYVSGFCHLRQDVRTFRLDRIQSTESTGIAFAYPSDFDIVGHVVTSLSDPPGMATIEVLFKASLDEARRSLPPELGSLVVVEEGVMLRRPAYRLEWVAALLLTLPFHIHIVQPPELHDIMRSLAEKAAALLDTTIIHEE